MIEFLTKIMETDPTLFWVLAALVALIVAALYLVFRPRSLWEITGTSPPRRATLNDILRELKEIKEILKNKS